ncbi:MAG: helix-turn-helix domain-containing protein [Spirochaetes bacterium]|nr:helix-turn-helix domain-containing protein [Spirochaetota bacterium]
MEPLGDYLKAVREEKNLTIDRIVKETHIIKKFIHAIEDDDYSEFPGEAYLKGFLRNYSEYLGLNADEIIRRYENIKLAEAPTPIEQLIPKPKPNLKPFVIGLIGLGLIIIGTGLFFGIKAIVTNPAIVAQFKRDKKKNSTEENIHVLKNEQSEFSLKKDEKVEISVDSVTYFIQTTNIYPYVKIVDSNDQESILAGEKPKKIDLNNDQKNDIEITLKKWDEKAATFFIRRITEEELVSSELAKYQEYLVGNTETLFSASTRSQINFTLNFNADTLVRYMSDDNPEVEKFYQRGSQLEINGTNKIILWLANAGAVNMQFKDKEEKIIPNEPGKVDVKLIYWKELSNGYALQMSSLK